MKIGSIDGTPEEIKNLCDNNGLDLAQYIEKPGQHMHKGYIIAPAVLFVLFLFLNVYVKAFYPLYTILVVCLSLASIGWLAISIQVKFSNYAATAIAFLVPLLIVLISAGYLLPSEIIPIIENLRKA